MEKQNTLELLAFTDPVCTWCWGSEPVLRKLQVFNSAVFLLVTAARNRLDFAVAQGGYSRATFSGVRRSKMSTSRGSHARRRRKAHNSGRSAGRRILVPCISAHRSLSLQAPADGRPLCSSLFASRANPRLSRVCGRERARVGGRGRARGHMRHIHVDRCFLPLSRHLFDGQRRIRARCDGC